MAWRLSGEALVVEILAHTAFDEERANRAESTVEVADWVRAELAVHGERSVPFRSAPRFDAVLEAHERVGVIQLATSTGHRRDTLTLAPLVSQVMEVRWPQAELLSTVVLQSPLGRGDDEHAARIAELQEKLRVDEWYSSGDGPSAVYYFGAAAQVLQNAVKSVLADAVPLSVPLVEINERAQQSALVRTMRPLDGRGVATLASRSLGFGVPEVATDVLRSELSPEAFAVAETVIERLRAGEPIDELLPALDSHLR